MKNTLFTTSLVLAALLSLTSVNHLAAAQSADPCKTQDNTIEINECGKQELAKEDKKLNAV